MHVVLIEQMAAGALAHENGARVAVVEHGGGAVQDAPACHGVICVAVVLDVQDAAWGTGRKAEAGVVEVRGRGAEGVDFLFV